MRATVVCVLLTFVVACMSTPDVGNTVSKILKQDPRTAEAEAKFSKMTKVAQIQANRVALQPVLKSKYKPCRTNMDCQADQQCVDYKEILRTLTGDDYKTFGTIFNQIDAGKKRCKTVAVPTLPVSTPSEQILFVQKIRKVSAVISDTYAEINKTGLTLATPNYFENTDEYVMGLANAFNEKPQVSIRTTQVGAGLDMNTFLLIALLDKDDSSSSSLSDLLPILLFTQGGTGMGGDLLSNPLLLFSLLDDDDSDSDTTDLLLIMTLMNGGGLGGSTDLLGSPLLLITLLDDDSTSMKDLLPILLLSGGLGGGITGRQAGGADLMNNPLLLLLLLDDDDDSKTDLSKLLPFILLGSMSASGMPGGATGMNQILPLILLLDNSTDITDLLLIMMVTQGGLGGTGGLAGGDMNSLLPILLLGDKLGGGLNDTKDLLLISLLSQGGTGGEAGIQSVLPLLLLSDSSVLNTSDTLTMLLILSGALNGGAGAGGAGGAPDMNLLLPLLLKDQLDDTKDLLLIMMLGGTNGLGGGAAGGAAGLQQMLPLLLLAGNSSMDTTTLVLVMMMSQAQPGSVSPTGVVSPDSSLNMILPILLLKDGGLGGSDDTLTMILLINMLSQGTAGTAGFLG